MQVRDVALMLLRLAEKMTDIDYSEANVEWGRSDIGTVDTD